MDARQAKERLAELRFQYDNGQITKDKAYELAKIPLEIYNNKAREIAKKYGVKPQSIKNNIIFWPSR